MFIQWVNEGQHSQYWDDYIRHFPLEEETVFEAKNFLQSFQLAPQTPPNVKSKIWDEIDAEISVDNTKKYLGFFVGIVFICALIFGFFYFQPQVTHVASVNDSLQEERWIEYTNDASDNWAIDLPDGSQVVLEPEAYLKYPIVFDQKSRKVQLTGNAFFDIAHDTLKPFYVYANEAVIRVLGTSFFVEAEEDDKDIKVIVKTGKVAVYKGKEVKEYQAKIIDKIEPLIVTPNQVATLSKKNLKLNKRLISRPTLTRPLDALEKIHFKNKSIHEIAQALSDAYSVEIIIAEDISTNCRLTTTLTDQPLFEKLKIICDPLGLKFKEKNLKIFITGFCN